MILEELVTRLVPPEISEWWEQIRGWQNCFPLRYEQDGRLSPQIVLESIAETAGDDAIIVTDVGQHQMWVAQSYPFKYPRQLVTSGGLGTMGFGLPAAVGAQVAQPEKKVVLITGDGSLQMTIQELATIVQHQLPVKIVLRNNEYWDWSDMAEKVYGTVSVRSSCMPILILSRLPRLMGSKESGLLRRRKSNLV